MYAKNDNIAFVRYAEKVTNTSTGCINNLVSLMLEEVSGCRLWVNLHCELAGKLSHPERDHTSQTKEEPESCLTL